MKHNTFKLTNLLSLSLIVFFLLISTILIFLYNYTLRKQAISDAKQQAKIILDKNLSVHKYFAQDLKPRLLKKFKHEIDKGYFDPAWMSSTHAIQQQNVYFSEFNKGHYYYKDAAINARNPNNEADTFEREYLERLNNNPLLPAEDGIINYKGKTMYYLIEKGEVMDKTCLRCHSDAASAPSGMVALYGNQRSFQRKEGEIVSAISIKIPIKDAYQHANRNTLYASIITISLLAVFIVLFYYFNNKIVLAPLKSISKQAKMITQNLYNSNNNIKMARGAELTDVITSFNKMSDVLYENLTQLDSKVKDRTMELNTKKKELEQSLIDTQSLLKEKEILIKEVNHRVKNNLNSIIYIIQLQKIHLRNENIEINALSNIQNRINIISFFHEMIYKSPDVSKISVKSYIEGIIDYLKSTSHLNANLQFLCNIDTHLNLSINTAKEIGMIINELVTNSIKYAFKGRSGGTIEISYLKEGNNIVLTIKDNGIGIPQDFEIESTTTLGLVMIQSLVEQFNGTMDIINDNGTTCTITFPYESSIST